MQQILRTINEERAIVVRHDVLSTRANDLNHARRNQYKYGAAARRLAARTLS